MNANEHVVYSSDTDCLDWALNLTQSNHKYDASNIEGAKVKNITIENVLRVSKKMWNLTKTGKGKN